MNTTSDFDMILHILARQIPYSYLRDNKFPDTFSIELNFDDRRKYCLNKFKIDLRIVNWKNIRMVVIHFFDFINDNHGSLLKLSFLNPQISRIICEA